MFSHVDPVPDAHAAPAVHHAQQALAATSSLRSSSSGAYAKDVRLFVSWGGAIPCEAATLRRYIVAQRTKVAPSTLHRRLMAVRHAHVSQGLASPTDDPQLRPVLRALQLGYVPAKNLAVPQDATPKRRDPKAAQPVSRRLLTTMLDYVHRSTKDRRDKAMLLLGFMAALKRTELASLNVGDIRFTADAMLVTLRQEGRAGKLRTIAVPATGGELCAAQAVRAWIEHASLEEQPDAPLFVRFDRGGDPTVFRLDAAYISVLVKQYVKQTGADPARYSAESLRRGRQAEAAKGVL